MTRRHRNTTTLPAINPPPDPKPLIAALQRIADGLHHDARSWHHAYDEARIIAGKAVEGVG